MGSWQVVLLEPAKTFLVQVGQFIGGIFSVLILLFIGWLLAQAIKTVVTRGLTKIRILDWISEKIQIKDILEKGGITYSLSELIGVICYWVTLLITFMVAINALGLTVAADLLNKVVLFVPNVIVAIFVLILGLFVATLLKNIVLTAATNAGLSQVKLLSKLVEYIVMIFVIVIAMEQLNIGVHVTELTLSIILGAIGLGLALAFGLGCKDLAAKYVGELIEKIKSKK